MRDFVPSCLKMMVAVVNSRKKARAKTSGERILQEDLSKASALWHMH